MKNNALFSPGIRNDSLRPRQYSISGVSGILFSPQILFPFKNRQFSRQRESIFQYSSYRPRIAGKLAAISSPSHKNQLTEASSQSPTTKASSQSPVHRARLQKPAHRSQFTEPGSQKPAHRICRDLTALLRSSYCMTSPHTVVSPT